MLSKNHVLLKSHNTVIAKHKKALNPWRRWSIFILSSQFGSLLLCENSRFVMLEWSPSLSLKMPRCLDLVNKLCSINNSSLHWKLTLSYWCHTVINYGDPDMIDNSLRNCVQLLFMLHFDLESSPELWTLKNMCLHRQPAIFVDTCFIYWQFMMVESNFAQSCKIRRNRPNSYFVGSFCDVSTLRSKEIDTYINLVKNLSFTTSLIWPM